MKKVIVVVLLAVYGFAKTWDSYAIVNEGIFCFGSDSLNIVMSVEDCNGVVFEAVQKEMDVDYGIAENVESGFSRVMKYGVQIFDNKQIDSMFFFENYKGPLDECVKNAEIVFVELNDTARLLERLVDSLRTPPSWQGNAYGKKDYFIYKKDSLYSALCLYGQVSCNYVLSCQYQDDGSLNFSGIPKFKEDDERSVDVNGPYCIIKSGESLIINHEKINHQLKNSESRFFNVKGAQGKFHQRVLLFRNKK